MATKKSTAKTSRNGRRRRRASAASWLSVTASPPTNAARASGTPNTAAPSPARAGPDPTRRDEEQVVLVAQPAQDAGAGPGDRHGHDREPGEPDRGLGQRSAAGSMTASRIAASATPTRSCTTLQPRSASSVGRSVVRRRLTVMLTMTIDDDRATHSPMSAAVTGSSPVTTKTSRRDARREDVPAPGCHRASAPWSRAARSRSDLDPDLEQEQHDADVGQQLQLLAVRDVARGERRERPARPPGSRRSRGDADVGPASRRRPRRAG